MTATAHDMCRAIYRSFRDRYAVVFEVTARGANMAGGRADNTEDVRHRRVDALLVRRAAARRGSTAARWQQMVAQVQQERGEGLFDLATIPPPPVSVPPPQGSDNGGIERVAIEIKVTRGDFLADIRDPDKQAPWRAMAERHAYCVPRGLVELHEVPATSGLLEVVCDGARVMWARKAPRVVSPQPLPLAVLLDAFYRWSRAEAVTRGLDQAGRVGDDIETVRAELARVRHQLELAEGARDREVDKTQMWKRFYAAAAEPPPCGTCGQPLRPGRRTDPYTPAWVHSKAAELLCQPQRQHDHRITYHPQPVYGWDNLIEAVAT